MTRNWWNDWPLLFPLSHVPSTLSHAKYFIRQRYCQALEMFSNISMTLMVLNADDLERLDSLDVLGVTN